MPYSLNVPDGIAERLDALAAALYRPREVVVDAPARNGGPNGDWIPSPGSPAADDLAQEIFEPEWNLGLVHHPRSVTSLHLLTSSHLLAGMAAALSAREVMGSPGVLARSAFENAIRGFLVIDPRITARKRTARALLADVVSADRKRIADKHLYGDRSPEFLDAQDKADTFKRDAERHFPTECRFADDHSRWSVAGQTYPRMNEAASSWAEWRITEGATIPNAVQAEGFYDYLCLHTHPQSYPGHQEADWRGGDAKLSVEFGILASTTLIAATAVLDLIERLYVWYHGWDVPELDEIHAALAAIDID